MQNWVKLVHYTIQFKKKFTPSRDLFHNAFRFDPIKALISKLTNHLKINNSMGGGIWTSRREPKVMLDERLKINLTHLG